MEVLSFDIKGKFAHFRKFFANNTAFSFSLPPRTTIMGIIAGALGLEKDTYYDDFSTDNINLGINILSEIKKSFHRLNYLMIKGDRDFRGRLKHIQTPFEIVSGTDIKSDLVKYRIFIAPTESCQEIYQRIKETFIHQDFRFNPTLGTANFTAEISNIKIYKEVIQKEINNEFVIIDSAGLSENISEIAFDKNKNFKYNMIEEELMPAEYNANNDREVIKMNRILFTTDGTPLKVRLKGKIFILKDDNNSVQNIQFLR